MSLRKRILKILYDSEIALSVKDICEQIHSPYGCVFCQEKICKYNQVARAVRELRELGLVKAFRTKIRNVNSPARYVNCVLIYVREEQLYKRLEIEKRSKMIIEYVTS